MSVAQSTETGWWCLKVTLKHISRFPKYMFPVFSFSISMCWYWKCFTRRWRWMCVLGRQRQPNWRKNGEKIEKISSVESYRTENALRKIVTLCSFIAVLWRFCMYTSFIRAMRATYVMHECDTAQHMSVLRYCMLRLIWTSFLVYILLVLSLSQLAKCARSLSGCRFFSPDFTLRLNEYSVSQTVTAVQQVYVKRWTIVCFF